MNLPNLPSRVCATYTEDLKAYFCKRASVYEQHNEFHPRLAKKLVASLADLQRGETVLDVATGTGYVAVELAKRLGSEGLVVGLDISKPMLKQVSKLLENITRLQSASSVRKRTACCPYPK